MSDYQKKAMKDAISALLQSGYFHRAYRLKEVLEELGEIYG